MSSKLLYLVFVAYFVYFEDGYAKAVGKINIKCTGLLSAFPPEPDTSCCGLDSTAGNKLIGANETSIDQYPWLALIEYVMDGQPVKTLCGGTLISGRYVLTAAHCVTGSILDLGKPKNVRLGEYDTSHPGMDCARVEAGGEDCNEGTVTIPIETIITHSEYNKNKQNHNDIALIRLKESAPFTDFIRPICLPTEDITNNPPSPLTLFAAGWGAVSKEKFNSAIKLHVDLPYVTIDKCQEGYRAPGRKATLAKGQLCAGGVSGKDSCKGDSGGPLMHENEKRIFHVVGVISFGPTPCALPNVSGVYTKVFEYKPWIKEQIKA